MGLKTVRKTISLLVILGCILLSSATNSQSKSPVTSTSSSGGVKKSFNPFLPSSSTPLFDPASTIGSRSCHFVQVLGLEGTGHHGFQPLIKKAALHISPKQHVVELDTTPVAAPEVHAAIIHQDYAALQRAAKQLSEDCNKLHITCTYRPGSGGSFPNSRSPFEAKLKSRKRWRPEHWGWLLENGHPFDIVKFYNAVSPYCDVKFLLLHRNFVEAVLTHSTWDTGPVGHSEVLLMFMKYISISLNKLPKSAWRRVNYEDIWRPDSAKVLTAMGQFLGWHNVDWVDILSQSGFRYNTSTPLPACTDVYDVMKVKRAGNWSTFGDKEQHVTKLALTNIYDSPRARSIARMCPRVLKHFNLISKS